jgi:hypothetical protein
LRSFGGIVILRTVIQGDKTMLASASHINNYPNVFGIQKNLSVEQLAKTLPADTKAALPTDALSISTPGNMMQQLLNLESQGSSGSSADNAELDMTGLAQLKEHGEMLSAMLKMKMQNFESKLVSSMRGGNASPQAETTPQESGGGMPLLNDLPNKESLESLMKKDSPMQNEYQSMANIAEMLQLLQVQAPPAAGVAAKYAQQAQK